MSLYYSTGSTKQNINSFNYSEGSSKPAISELYYSNGTSKLPVWTGGGLGPIGKNDFVIFGLGTAYDDNGISQWWNSSLTGGPTEYKVGDMQGLLNKDFFGNLYFNYFTNPGGDGRRNTLNVAQWNPNTNTFLDVRNLASWSRTNYSFYVDRLSQFILIYGYYNSSVNFRVFKPYTTDPSVGREYSLYDQNTWNVFPSVNYIQFGGANPSARDIFVVCLSGSIGWSFYYTNFTLETISLVASTSNTYEAGKLYIFNETSGSNFGSKNYVILNSYVDYRNGPYNTKILRCDISSKSLTTITTIPDYQITSDVGFTNDFSEYVYDGNLVKSGVTTPKYLFYNIKKQSYVFKDHVKPSGAQIVPTQSTSSHLTEFVVETSNLSGNKPYYLDVKIGIYVNGVLQRETSASQLLFSTASPRWICNTPNFNYYKNSPLSISNTSNENSGDSESGELVEESFTTILT